jgi:hypothetical protein
MSGAPTFPSSTPQPQGPLQSSVHETTQVQLPRSRAASQGNAQEPPQRRVRLDNSPPPPDFFVPEIEIEGVKAEIPSEPTVKGQVHDATSHEIRPRDEGTGISLQCKAIGEFNMPPTPFEENTATFFYPGSPVCNGATNYLNGAESSVSADGLLDMQNLLMSNLYAVSIASSGLVGVLLSIFISMMYVTSNADGRFGDHGRSRFEAPFFCRAIIKMFFDFARFHQQNLSKFTSSLLFKYMSRPDIDEMMAKITTQLDRIASRMDNVANSLRDRLNNSLIVLQQALLIPHSIRKHKDHPGNPNLRYFKAIFMHNTTGEPYFWDFYSEDNTLVCTVRIESNSCLFISDFALGMKFFKRRI